MRLLCGPSLPCAIKRAVSYLKKHYRSYMKGEYWSQASAYSLSLVVLALHDLYAKDPDLVSAEDRAAGA